MVDDTDTGKMITREDMVKMLEEERLIRERLATEQVNNILAQHRCEMEVGLSFGNSSGVKTQFRIVALP